MGGALARKSSYFGSERWPVEVQHLIDQGWEVYDMVSACSMPRPKDGNIKLPRLAAYVLEAIFSVGFHLIIRDYGLDHLGFWPAEEMEFDGLCTHISLADGIRRLDLTAEDIKNAKIHLRKQQKAWYKKNGPQAAKRRRQAEREKHRKRDREKRERAQKKDPVKYKVKSKEHKARQHANAVAKKKFPCWEHSRFFGSPKDLRRHMASGLHN